jgi:plastocyanin
MKRTCPIAALLLTAVVSSACGGADGAGSAAAPAGPSAPSAATTSSVPLTGNVIEVEMASRPGMGEVFSPAELTVKRGDVVRFKLVSGVHNASFPANKNPGGVALPAATPYLQAPGQTHDVAIDLPAGEYHYQCDPHVALGMVGKLVVTE